MLALPLISGGKDSLYAMYLAMQQGFEINRILTVIPEDKYSYMYHTPNLSITEMQAQAMGLKCIKIMGEKDDELLSLKKFLEDAYEDFVIVGAVASEYQFYRILFVCEEIGKKVYSPLWRKDPLKLLKNLVLEEFEVIIVSVAAEGLGKEFLGRKIDEETVKILEEKMERYGVNPIGEGGEFETCVLNAPIFRRKIKVKRAKIDWRGSHGYYIIEDAELV